MTTILLDCYTDEPAGLGVPPYLGTYPRYIYGFLKDEDKGEKVEYLTIDDLRLIQKLKKGKQERQRHSQKTDILTYNATGKDAESLLADASRIITILGVHTPGKYLSAVPGTLKEAGSLLQGYRCEKILTGPAVFGTASEGGRFFEKTDLKAFDKVEAYDFSYDEISRYAVDGAELVKQIPDIRIIEIETGRGCTRKKGCSFCLEPVKHKLAFREEKDIVREMQKLCSLGVKHFRLGKQSCFYSYPDPAGLLKSVRDSCKDLSVLHIDNANPAMVVSKRGEEITKAIAHYCTAGNVAAFGVESFDNDVVEANNLNSTPETSFEAVKVINTYGAEMGSNGLPKFLPGINLLFGLIDESKQTNEQNLLWLKKMMDEGLLLRRINIRQVDIFEGTNLYETCGNKFLRKNKKYYWKWRNSIRQEIDYPMLKKIAPAGTVLNDVRTEVHDGNNTFARQIGTYPLIVGIKGRIPLKQFVDVEITGHMLRSVTGRVIETTKFK